MFISYVQIHSSDACVVEIKHVHKDHYQIIYLCTCKDVSYSIDKISSFEDGFVEMRLNSVSFNICFTILRWCCIANIFLMLGPINFVTD